MKIGSLGIGRKEVDAEKNTALAHDRPQHHWVYNDQHNRTSQSEEKRGFRIILAPTAAGRGEDRSKKDVAIGGVFWGGFRGCRLKNSTVTKPDLPTQTTELGRGGGGKRSINCKYWKGGDMTLGHL